MVIVGLTSSPVVRAIISLAGDPEMARRLDEVYLRPRRKSIADILNRAIAAGELRPDIDVEMAIDLLVGASVYRWLVTAQPVDADSARRVVNTVWESLRAPSP